MGALSFIQVAADSVGKKVRTFLGTDGTHSETAVIVDTEGVQQATSGAPLRVDPTGTTTQPVSGSVSVSNFPASSDVDANLDEVSGVAITLGQKAMASSLPVVLSSDQASIPVTLSGGTNDVDANIDEFGGTAVTLGQKVAASSIPVVLDSDTDRGQKAMASSLPVAIASDQSAVSTVRILRATYEVMTAELTLGTAVAKNRIISLFHPVGVVLAYQVLEIWLYFKQKHTVGVGQYKISFATVAA